MSTSKSRLLFWHWHRRLGITTAVFIILLSVTGIALNHSTKIGLADTPVRVGWLLSLYGLSTPDITSYAVGEHTLSHLGDDHLYLDTEKLSYCAGGLSGALVKQDIWVAACRDELLLLTPQGEVIERVGGAYGLPHPITAIGHCEEQLCLESEGQVYITDVDQLRFTRRSETGPSETVPSEKGVASFESVATIKLDDELRRALLDSYYGSTITWERIVLDLHSGHLLQLGPWLMDMVGLLMIALAVTGITMWYKGRRRPR
ncbi:MAG: PepSY domain-containing protein [Porticoccaceae bacterium]|nr:PepSY domain-containing protein [Porticoccaceae bacterium]